MDSKSLLGAYVCTATPGEFVWQPGPLMQAVAGGKWVLIEDANLAPPEVLASLVPLLERRVLSIPARGESIAAAPGFQLIATVTSAPRGGGTATGAYGSSAPVRNLLGGLLHYVHVSPPPPSEQMAILAARHPSVAPLVPHVMHTLGLVRAAYLQQQQQQQQDLPAEVVSALATAGAGANNQPAGLGSVGRHFSIRDALKLCRRLASVHALLLARSLKPASSAAYSADVSAVPLPVRQAAFTESADCFGALLARPEAARWLLVALAALWALPSEEAMRQYSELHKPAVQLGATDLVIGRVALPLADPATAAAATGQLLAAAATGAGGGGRSGGGTSRFAPTGHALRHMERIAVAVSQGEPVLLVGETGTGKTTTVQQIARQVNCVPGQGGMAGQ